MSRGLLFSVLTAAWNTDPRFLRKCVESVIGQSYAEWELCLVDDGSARPETLAMLQRLAGQDPRIRLAHNLKRRGISFAQNRALEMARGDFVALVDHDDILERHALEEVAKLIEAHPDADVIYTDEDQVDTVGNRLTGIRKPDWSPTYLARCSYINHLTVYRRELAIDIGGFRPDYELAQDWDLAFRMTGATTHIHHIPQILYHWQRTPGSAGHRDDAQYWRKRCHADHVRERISPDAVSIDSPMVGFFQVRVPIVGTPLTSVIVPMGRRANPACLRSVLTRTEYPNFEVIIVAYPVIRSTFEALRAVADGDPRARLVEADGSLDFAQRVNLGAAQAHGEHLLLLADDTEVITGEWMTAMLELSQEPGVGVVGAKLRFPNGAIGTCGLALGPDGLPCAPFRGYPEGHTGHLGSLVIDREYTAVSGACQMVRAKVFAELQGYDSRYGASLAGVDFCLRARAGGYRVVGTPRAQLFQREPGIDLANCSRREVERWHDQWGHLSESYWHPESEYEQSYFLSVPHATIAGSG